MINFHNVTQVDKEWISKYVSCRKSVSCEYSFGNIFTYSAKYNILVADYNNCFLSEIDCGDTVYYSYPAGYGDIKTVLFDLVTYIKHQNKSSIIYGMNKAEADCFNSLFSDEYFASPVRASFDYCYNSTDLINLQGKKYQPKRNHISYFKKNNNWVYEKITSANISECLEMSKMWLEQYQGDKSDLEDELKIINKAFLHYDSIDYVGGLIRVDGKVIAYTMGEALDDDHFCVHIEKAFPQIRGAYQIINNEFVKNELSSFKYINREDDVGLENLRKAKLSYHPAYFEEKFEAKII